MLSLKQKFGNPLFAVVCLTLAAVLVFQAPAAAAAPSYTWTNYNAGDIQYRFPATVSSEYGEFVYMESGTPDDTYYFSWDIPIPISATIVSGYYMNGYSSLTIDVSRAFGQGTTVRSLTYELTESTGLNHYSNIQQVLGTYSQRIVIRTNYINLYTHTGTSRSIDIGTLHVKVQGTSSSPYDDMSLSISGQTSSSDSNVTYSLEAKLDQYYFDMLYALGNASEIDDIIYYLTALATYGANVSGYLATIRYEQLPGIISYLTNIQTYTQNTATQTGNIAWAAGQINTQCIQIYATLQSIYGVDQTISADLQDLIAIIQSSIAENAAQQSAAETNVAEASNALDSAGDQMSVMASEMEISKPDINDVINAADSYMDEASVQSQQQTFSWLNKPIIILILSLVFALAIISYALYGGQ